MPDSRNNNHGGVPPEPTPSTSSATQRQFPPGSQAANGQLGGSAIRLTVPAGGGLANARRRDHATRIAMRKLKGKFPHLEGGKYDILLRRYCETELLLQRLAYLTKATGLLRADGSIMPSVNEFRRLALAASTLAERLSITPKTENELLSGRHPAVIEAVSKRIEEAVLADQAENQGESEHHG